VHDANSFIGLYRRLMAVLTTTPMFSGFCYTQFSDTFQEVNGLLYADRCPKVPLDLIYAATRHDVREEEEGHPGKI
jgi:hypothetical protein